MTWLLISHQLVHVRKICDQVHFMEQGNVLVSGTPEEILLHPSHPSIRRYLADTEVSYRENEKKIQKYEYKCEAIALNMKKMGRVFAWDD